MNSDRIKEIQETTAYPDSVSVKQALLQVWNECEQGSKVLPASDGKTKDKPDQYERYVDDFMKEPLDASIKMRQSQKENDFKELMESYRQQPEGVDETIKFGVWYSGMKRDQVEKAYQRYLKEIKREDKP